MKGRLNVAIARRPPRSEPTGNRLCFKMDRDINNRVPSADSCMSRRKNLGKSREQWETRETGSTRRENKDENKYNHQTARIANVSAVSAKILRRAYPRPFALFHARVVHVECPRTHVQVYLRIAQSSVYGCSQGAANVVLRLVPIAVAENLVSRHATRVDQVNGEHTSVQVID